MAKQVMPGMKAGSGFMSKAVGMLVTVVILVIVVKYPGNAADFVKMLFGWIDQFATFLRELGG